MDDYHLGKYPQEMLPLRKALMDFLGPMMGPLDLATVMNPITPLSALEWTRDKDELARQLKNYEGRIDNFIGRSPLEESQNFTRNIIRVRSQVVISAMHALVMHLAGLREGRKTLVFVSRGIPLMFDISLEPDFQAMLREANRGNVMIHTLDPRGLGQGIFPHDTMYRMAAETGGQAIVNTNNLSAGLERVIRDASHHYLVGYTPTRETERRQVPSPRGEGEAARRPHRRPQGLLGADPRRADAGAGRAARAGGVGRADQAAGAAGRSRRARHHWLRAGRGRADHAHGDLEARRPASAIGPSSWQSRRAATAARRSAPARARWATTALAWPGWRCRPATSPLRYSARGASGEVVDRWEEVDQRPRPERRHLRHRLPDLHPRADHGGRSRHCARASQARPVPIASSAPAI